MAIFQSKRVKALEDKIQRLERSISGDWDLQGMTLLDLIKENQGGVVSPMDAMKIPAVLAAVSLRSGLFASFPKKILRRTADGREEVKDHPLYNILSYRPNPYMNAYTFWELVNTHVDLWGNSYVYISRYDKEVKRLTPIHPRNVEVKVEGGDLVYKVTGTGVDVLDKTHKPDRILHFKDISFDGYKGISRVDLINKTLSISQSAQEFAKGFFDKGGIIKGVIETDAPLDDDHMTAFAKAWAANADHGTPVLDRGKKYKQLTIPMEEAQLNSILEFCIQEIARAWHVPSSLINENSRSTFSNITQLDLQFVKYGLRSGVKRYEHEIEYKLLGDTMGEEFMRFDLDGIMRGDAVSRADYFAKLKQNELYTTNEIRIMNGDNPIDDPKADMLENPSTTSNKKTDEN